PVLIALGGTVERGCEMAHAGSAHGSVARLVEQGAEVLEGEIPNGLEVGGGQQWPTEDVGEQGADMVEVGADEGGAEAEGLSPGAGGAVDTGGVEGVGVCP